MGTAPHPVLPDGVVVRTLAFSDLVDSTTIVRELGDARAAELFAAADRTTRDLLALHAGVEIDKSDGFLAVFERPWAAVAWAIGLHRGLREVSAAHGATLAARVGIHLGEVHVRAWVPETLPGELRLGMYDTIRAYAGERLAEAGGNAAAELRHAEHYARLGGVVSRCTDPGLGMRRAQVDLENLIAAVRRVASPAPDVALECLLLASWVISHVGPRTELDLEEAVELGNVGVLRHLQGRHDEARDAFDLATGRLVGPQVAWPRGHFHAHAGALAADMSRLGDARRQLDMSRQDHAAVGDAALGALIDVCEGHLDLAEGRVSGARARLQSRQGELARSVDLRIAARRLDARMAPPVPGA